MIGMLHERGERYLRLKFGLPSYKRESDREHVALLKAVRRGDVAAAQSLVTRHLVDTGELLYRYLSRGTDAATPVPAASRSRRR
jgi:DNA-binding GntR family transcriptional regulator